MVHTGRNPFRVVEVRRHKPRVAWSKLDLPLSQPWAGGRNPFEIASLRGFMVTMDARSETRLSMNRRANMALLPELITMVEGPNSMGGRLSALKNFLEPAPV
jgi:hypothetical protein